MSAASTTPAPAVRSREPVGTGYILCSSIKVGPVTVFRNSDGSMDANFRIVDISLDPKKV